MEITKAVNKKIANKIQSIVDEIDRIADSIENEEGETELATALWSAQANLEMTKEELELL